MKKSKDKLGTKYQVNYYVKGKRKRVDVYMEEYEKELLEYQAKQNNMSISKYVNKLIIESLPIIED